MLSINEKAKELVNKIYQPLGYLSCNVSSRKMWNYAKERASEWVDEIIETDMLNDESEYVNTKSYLYFWKDVKKSISEL